VHLYSGSTAQFVRDAVLNRLAGRLSDRFFDEFRYKPPLSEVSAWQNSLRAMADVLQLADLREQGILVELQLPLTSKRLDCLVTGSDRERGDSAVIVELKQWTTSGRSSITDCVTAVLGGRERDTLHPSVQAAGYHRYLLDTHDAFSDGRIALDSCAYLHNHTDARTSPIFDLLFREILEGHPAFTGGMAGALADYMDARVNGPDDGSILDRVAAASFRPSKRLLDHVARTIAAEPTFVLLDEQQVAFNAILDEVRAASGRSSPVVFLIQGGPGTGKSVIAVNLIAEISRMGLRAIHATGSKAFTENLRRNVGRRASALFSYFKQLRKLDEPVDVVILDEAHRIREVSTDRFTPVHSRTGKPQIEEIMDAGRVTVFLIDDRQVVRPGEVGSTELIRSTAGQRGVEVREFELEAQFRANGSDAFIQWVDNTLDVARTPQVLWQADDPFVFEIVPTVQELEAIIRKSAISGTTARLVAGFCWPWSDPTPEGLLPADVRVGDWAMPWNANAAAGKLAQGVPKSDYWASDPDGINQVGCVYTAQGFEFDVIGVIFGPDLVYRPGTGWMGQPEQSKDRVVRRGVSREAFTEYVKNTYRVLLTRGLRACYVTFLDRPTRDYVWSRIERPAGELRRVAEAVPPYGSLPQG
jgi:hypothetical protein